MRARYWPVMVLSASLPANGFAVMDDKHATPDFERVLGHQDRCYELSASGSSNLPSELLLAGTSHSPGVTRVAEARSPFLLSVDLEGQSRELAFTAKTGRFLELRGAVRLSDDAIVVAGVTSEGQVLELVDRTGKVTQTAKVAGDVNVRGMERGSANDFVVYGSLGSRPYYAGLNRSLAVMFERFPAGEAASGQVLKARYAAGRDGLWIAVQQVEASAEKATVTLVKDDLLGNRIASTEVPSIYADFDETPGGIALLYYTAVEGVQKIHVAYFDKTLGSGWQADPVQARLGVAGPRIVGLKDKVLVVAADEFKLVLAALDLKGKALWTYHEEGPSLSPGGTYLMAHDGAHLLLAQPDRRGGDATHPAPDPSCTRIRVVRF